MKPKTIEIEGTTYLVMQDGKPVYTMDDGTDQPVDPSSMHSKILELNKEGATRRARITELEDAAKAFEGITDPAAAVKALETVANLNDKQLVDAGEVERVKNAAIEALKETYEPLENENKELKSQLHNALVGGEFGRSTYLTEKTTMSPTMAEALFGKHFTVKDGKIEAKGPDGNPIYSPDPGRAGEVATFDEALAVLIKGHPDQKRVLQGANQDGSGGQGGGDGGDTGGTITRADYEKLPHDQRREVLKTKKLVDA